MSNIAFVLRQSMPYTQRLLSYEKELDEHGKHLANLVRDVSGDLGAKGTVRRMLELYELEELGRVAGILLYSGDKGYEEKIDIILVPDLKALAIREDFGHKHHQVTREDTFTLYKVIDLYRDGGQFVYAPPRAVDGIEEAIVAKLEELNAYPV